MNRRLRYNVTKNERGNSRGYGLQRLARERPDLVERVRSGELSTHAAMLEAGLRKRTVTLPTDLRRAATKLCEIFSPEELRVIRRALDLELLPEPEAAPIEKRIPVHRRIYYAVVQGEEVSKHRKLSKAFQAVDKVVRQRKQKGEPSPEVWVRDDWGRHYD